VSRQYLGKLGKIDNGIGAVTAWGLIDNITLPLIFAIYKQKSRLKAGDIYYFQPEIAARLVEEIHHRRFQRELVLANSLYGESETNFLGCLEELKLNFVVGIRSNHRVWLPALPLVRQNKWRKFNRIFSENTQEKRLIREIIFGKKGDRRYWEVTRDPEKFPPNSSWYVMTEIPDLSNKDVANIYGCRNWVEYARSMSKNELRWADFRPRRYESIEKWWELVSSAYLLVSLFAPPWRDSNSSRVNSSNQLVINRLSQHPNWDLSKGWKSFLNNLRLTSQPFIYFNLIQRWLKIFPIPQLSLGFSRLISLMNFFPSPIAQTTFTPDFLFSSA